ncbi:MAG: hypothetical protein IJI96_02710 [Methanobrevibacter sp.]|nr:hypothetical protein [Methanobrevibacter sp.]MBQ6627418.1 hypothetical protein [Methanobrevibacter sp.]
MNTIKNVVTQEPDGSVILTAPVMIPGVPDCDFDRGEPPLTVEQIKYFEKTYHDYHLNDDEHRFEFTGETIGKPVESWILDTATDFTLLNGAQKSYPTGTWMLSTRITDPNAVQTALTGGYTGYSPTVKNREVADRLISALKSELITYPEFMGACKSHSMDGLIKDVVDPVVLSVSLTRKPCQHHSKFCKHNISGENMVNNDSDVKTKVLAALGMTNEAEVSALKSQVDTLDEKIDGMEEKFESSLKSMEENFTNTLKEALSEVGSSKSKNDDDDDDNGDGDGDPEPNPDTDGNTNPPANKDDDDDDEDGDPEPPQNKKKGASKSKPLHNNGDPAPKEEINTYKAMGRNPDGTAKRI